MVSEMSFESVGYDDFFNFSIQEYSMWLLSNVKRLLENRDDANLFSPAMLWNFEDDFHKSFAAFESGLPLSVQLKLRQGLKLAVQDTLKQEYLDLASKLIEIANYLRYAEVQDVNLNQRYMKNTQKYFQGHSNVVALLLDNIEMFRYSCYAKELLQKLDEAFDAYGLTRAYVEDESRWRLAMKLFFFKIDLESSGDFEKLTQKFIARMNRIIHTSSIEEGILISNLTQFMCHLSKQKITSIKNVAQECLRYNISDTFWLLQPTAICYEAA